ncbi:MAG: response regulator [Fibrobacterota bacterium]
MNNCAKYTVLAFAGPIVSISECQKVADAIRASFREGNRNIAVDFAGVSEVSGSFTGFLSELFKEINGSQGCFFFFNVNRKICEVFELLGMDNLIRNEFTPSIERPLALVVEDDPTVRELSREYLMELGYRCLEAENGKEGLELYERNKDRIAFLLSDIEMPVMDGQQMLESLYRIDPHVRIIMATGYSNAEKVRRIKALRDVEILQKPYFCADLEKAIQNTFRKSAFPAARN